MPGSDTPLSSSTARSATRASRLSTVALLMGLVACGGGGGGGGGEVAGPPPAPTPAPALSTTNTFPVGLAVATPGDLTTGVTFAQAPAPWRVAVAFSREAAAAAAAGDGRALMRLLARSAPFPSAHAGLTGTPSVLATADLLKKVLDSDATVTLASLIDLEGLFGVAGTDANCYGPKVKYASHQDAGTGPASGELPSGDVGMWLATEPDGQPCVLAEMSRRVSGSRRQGMQGLLVAAVMRRTIASTSGLAMPAAGGSTDLTAALQPVLAAAMPSTSVTVVSATLGLNATSTTYTYRLVLTNGLSGANAKRGEIILRHSPGSSSTAYSGTLEIAGFSLGSDPVFGCSDQVDATTSLYKVARASTLKYSRNGNDVSFGSRMAAYCGHPSGSGTRDAAQVATFTSDNQLDPRVGLPSGAPPVPRGATLGWRGDFARYAGDYAVTTGAGTFQLAWQAGSTDGYSRSLVARTLALAAGMTVAGSFAYAEDIATTTGPLLGMICNWAGPGNRHTPITRFQTQTAAQSGTGAYALVDNKITYAPTNSCASTTTSFDVNADGTLAAGEGVGTTSTLDGLTGTNTTVDQEMRSRGLVTPSMF